MNNLYYQMQYHEIAWLGKKDIVELLILLQKMKDNGYQTVELINHPQEHYVDSEGHHDFEAAYNSMIIEK